MSAATLAMSGPVTLAEVHRWHKALLAVLADGPARIDLAATGPWDLAGVQLLLSAIISARKSNQAIEFVHVPRVLLEIAERAGVADTLAPAIVDRLP